MKRSQTERKVERMKRMFETDKVNFDLVIQRKNDIWDEKRKSMLIHSILVDYPIPSLFAVKEESVFNFLDGKQRLTSIFSYLNDEFALDSTTPKVDSVEVAGKVFSDLSDAFKQRILDYPLEINAIEEITEQEMEELFYRLNNGVPLRKIETTRAILGSKVLKYVEEVADRDFFKEKVNLSKTMRQRYVDQELVLQILALVKNGETGFSSKEIQSFVQTLRDSDVQDELNSKMQNACYYLNRAFIRKEKFLKKIHVPMLFKLVLDMQQSGSLIPEREFAEWAEHFLTNPPEDYSEACASGSARKEKVQRRLSIMSQAFQAFCDIRARRVAENPQLETSSEVIVDEADKEAI